MVSYIIRRVLYAIPVILGVNIIVFSLFFFVNTPDDMARLHLGAKRSTPEQIDRWKREHSLNYPYFWNSGWTTISSIQALQKKNIQKINVSPGEFEIWLETPKNKKLASKREVSLKLPDMDRIKFENNEFQNGKIYRPAEIGTEKFGFTILPDESYEKENSFKTVVLEITFLCDAPAPTHRMILKYKRDIPLTEKFSNTIFYTRSLQMVFFQYGKSENGKNIGNEILKRILPSMLITIPAFILGLLLNVFIAMILVFFHKSNLDRWGVFLAVISMSISMLFYIIFSQFIFGKWLKIFPISGFDLSGNPFKFVAMPIMISILSGLGGSIRFYRTIFLEEINKEYVLTAKAKGLKEHTVLFVHVLKNAMIPILTSVVVHLPFLFIGSLLLESFFAIPGLGAYMIEAIQHQDFAVVQSMVSLGSFLYILGLLLTDISYTLVDPRIRFN